MAKAIVEGKVKHESDEEIFLKDWASKSLSLTQTKKTDRKAKQIILPSPLNFNEPILRLKTRLESELAKRTPHLKYGSLPEVIPDNAIVDMTGCPICDEPFFTSEELLILSRYKKL